jgi:ABC-type uncharacterized transport system auxiliary subunit
MIRAAALAALAIGCGRSLPDTHFYTLARGSGPLPASSTTAVLAIEPFDADRPYDDDRMVYRLDPYRMDFYTYDRWSAPPGEMIGAYIADVAAKSGRFRAVVRDGSADAQVTLGGRVIAIEEVDVAPGRSVARLVIDLEVRDANARSLWHARFEETEPMVSRDPQGLARATTTALQRVLGRALPSVVEAGIRVASSSAR